STGNQNSWYGSDEFASEEAKEDWMRRNGKIAAMNRGMKYVKTPIVVFSDGNTKLGKNSLRKIAALFADKKVGCVAGEKRIVNKDTDSAAGSGEGIYWKYESWLKRKEAHVYSVVGAAGELFAIRTDLFQEVEADTLLDDFIISLRVAMQGYEIQYDPEAYAIEVASANVKEELKRKIRIAAGGMQSMKRLAPLLNIFRYGMLSFQYWSHKVLRWVAVPISLLLVFFVNMDLAAEFVLGGKGLLYFITFVFQLLFYLMVLTGWMLEEKEVKFKIIFVPYYLFIMNLCMYLGFFRYISGKQSVNWQRAQRGK
ncbi:MAG: glycosyl transferase, partial [Marinilabiliales bacterium]